MHPTAMFWVGCGVAGMKDLDGASGIEISAELAARASGMAAIGRAAIFASFQA